jgi:formate dehydrogenase iron-sulfur subunit
MGGTTYLYLLLDSPEVYGLPVNPTIPLSLTLWKDVIRPVGGIAVGGAAAAVLIGVFANLFRGNYRSSGDQEENASTNDADSKKGGKK